MIEDIESIVFDVDGVLTDAKYHISATGEIHKTYCVYDINALRELAAVFKVILLTHSSIAHQYFFDRVIAAGEKLNISLVHVEIGKDKLDTLRLLVNLDKTMYIGDSIQDYSCMNAAWGAYYPKTAETRLKYKVLGHKFIHQLPINGGEGVAACIRDIISYHAERQPSVTSPEHAQ